MMETFGKQHRRWQLNSMDEYVDTLKQDIRDHLENNPNGQVKCVCFLVDDRLKVGVKGFRLRVEGMLPDHIFHDEGKMMKRAKEGK